MLYEMKKPDGSAAFVNLLRPEDVAKFLLFTKPRLGWEFTGNDTPKMKLTETVTKLIAIKNRMDARKAASSEADPFPPFDDKIPF